jgi:ubiquinone/menaquinone biosynthesis C-methylase UbiE
MELSEYVENNKDPWDLKKTGIDYRRKCIIKKFLEKKGIVLDIGCAFGIYSDFLSCIGNRVIGLDVSKRMINEASETYNNVNFVLSDSDEMPFKKETFDAVLLMGTCIYVKDKNKLFSEIFRIMKNGGALCIIERNKHSPWHSIFERFRKETSVDETKNFVSLTEVKYLLEKNGFKIEKITGDYISVPLFSENKITRRVFWSLGEIMPSFSYFLVFFAKK